MTKIRCAGCVAVALGLLLLAGCGGGGSGGGGNTAGVSSTEITIGQSTSLSGPIATTGIEAKSGVNAYLDKVNDEGGVNGRTINLIELDDAYSPPKAVTNTRALIDQHDAFALFMYFGTPTTSAALPYIESKEVPLIAPQDPVQSIIEPTIPQVFLLNVTWANQAKSVISYLAKEEGIKKFGVVYVNSELGKEGVKGAEEATDATGTTLVGTAPYSENATDFSAQIQTLRSKDPEAVFVAGTTPDIARFALATREAGWSPQLASWQTGADPSLIELGGSAVDGLIAGSPLKPFDSKDAAVAEYRKVVEAAGGKPSFYSELGYVSAEMLVRGLEAAGKEPTRESLIEGLNKLKNWDNGITDTISFSPDDHGPNKATVILKVEGNKFVPQTEFVKGE